MDIRKPIGFLFALLAGLGATQAWAEESTFMLTLDSLVQAQKACRVVFVAQNKLGVRLEKTAMKIAIFDDKGGFSGMVIFDFGRLPNGKTRVVQYDLPRDCSTISRLVYDSFDKCEGEGGQDLTRRCEDGTRTSSRAKIELGQ